jgi:AraC-like DNA-binding protein
MTIVFDAEVLARAVPGADRRLLPIVERHLEELLASKDGNVLDDVRNAIAEALCDGAPTIRVVAKRLGASVRTLQRRLAAHGAVFTTLVEDVRRDVALRYLADGKAAVTEIAFLTGYSEPSAFGRAFRRWTGSTPLAARKRLQASGPS